MHTLLRNWFILILTPVSILGTTFDGHTSEGTDHIVINEVLSSNTRSNYDDDFGAFSDWIELYNPTISEIDIGGWYFSDNPANPDKWLIPANTVIPSNGYLLFWADGRDLIPGQTAFVEFTEIHEILVSEYHLNFRINRDKEEVLLYNANLELVDSIVLTNQERDYSYGRNSSNPESWSYLGEPTPLAENSDYTSNTFVTSGKPLFSITGGLYPAAQSVELSAAPEGSIIKYTTDGSEPASGSHTYSEPLPVYFSQVIKARLFEAGKLPGEVVTESFIIDKETDLPVLSVSTNHQNLWDFDFGLYQNNLKNREVFAHLEYYDVNGNKDFSINAGLQLFGSQIFLFDQKPFSIFFRNRYGQDSLNYRLFQNTEIETYKSLVLRNGGNDNNLTMFRDGLGAAIIENEMDIDYQSYKAVVVYMNGQYWGIFNLREKLNNDYLQSQHQVNPDHIDILEDSLRVNDGDANNYSELIDFASNNDLSLEHNFSYISEKMDIDEFINYMSYKIYGGYKQWQVNNKYWRERTRDSKWRWIAFDLEHCFNGPGGENYDSNTFLSALEPASGPAEWPTLLFRQLMENENFRAEFIQRTALFLNTTLSKERVLHIIDSLQNGIGNEIEDHINRWNAPVSKAAWLQNSNFLKQFAENRNPYMFQHMMEYFNIPDTSLIAIRSSQGGKVVVCSSYILNGDSVTFTLFNDIPVNLAAMPEPGFAFTGWNNKEYNKNISLVFNKDTSVFASFEKTDQNIIPDTIRGTMVLDDNTQPWFSEGNIIIPSGDSLIISEGVKILMMPNSSLMNYGFLEINGTDTNPVTLDINPNVLDTYYKSGHMKWGAICIQSPDTTRISNAILENSSSGNHLGNFKAAISTTNSILFLEGVTIHDVQNPVYCYKSEVIINSCTLSSNGTGDLINLRACNDPEIRNNNLKGNFYEDTDAIDLDSVNNALIENNLIYSFFGLNSDGIDLGESSKNIVIRNNTIFSCSDKGISVGQGSETEVTNNLIVDCNQGLGIKDFHSFADINQNTLYNNRFGIACFEKNPGKGGGTAQVENTIIVNSTEQSVFVDALSSLTASYSISDRDTLQGYNNLYGNPLFAGASDHNFYLRPGSPCINTGNPNQEDPDGTRADIGAFISENSTTNHSIIINEVNYISSSCINSGDWIEIYNNSNEQVDISNWVLKGGNPEDEYIFPDHLILMPKDYLIVAENRDSIESLYGNNMNLAGNFMFGLNREGEVIKLYNEDYQLIHSLQYSSAYPWPDGPNGKGATLELYTGDTDNSHHGNWHASYIRGGTPGEANSETIPLSGLYINEFMAKNDNAYADENGEFDDWIEVYNANNFNMDLGGLNFIYGNSDQRLSMIPLCDEEATTIEAHGFKLFWADKDPEQGILHQDFNISASGGTVGLAQVIEKQIHIVDQIVFNEQTVDIAFGRYPDGAVFLTELYLTPGATNNLLNTNDHPGKRFDFLIYPNPANRFLFIEHPDLVYQTKCELRNMSGQTLQQIILEPGDFTRIDVSGLPAGIYFLLIRGQHTIVEKVIIY